MRPSRSPELIPVTIDSSTCSGVAVDMPSSFRQGGIPAASRSFPFSTSSTRRPSSIALFSWVMVLPLSLIVAHTVHYTMCIMTCVAALVKGGRGKNGEIERKNGTNERDEAWKVRAETPCRTPGGEPAAYHRGGRRVAHHGGGREDDHQRDRRAGGRP